MKGLTERESSFQTRPGTGTAVTQSQQEGGSIMKKRIAVLTAGVLACSMLGAVPAMAEF